MVCYCIHSYLFSPIYSLDTVSNQFCQILKKPPVSQLAFKPVNEEDKIKQPHTTVLIPDHLIHMGEKKKKVNFSSFSVEYHYIESVLGDGKK